MTKMITLKELGRPFFVIVNADAIKYVQPFSTEAGSKVVFDAETSLLVEDAPIDILSKISAP